MMYYIMFNKKEVYGVDYYLLSIILMLLYRLPMRVKKFRRGFPVCPRCNTTIEREYQAYCDRCGQCLKWEKIAGE